MRGGFLRALARSLAAGHARPAQHRRRRGLEVRRRGVRLLVEGRVRLAAAAERTGRGRTTPAVRRGAYIADGGGGEYGCIRGDVRPADVDAEDEAGDRRRSS